MIRLIYMNEITQLYRTSIVEHCCIHLSQYVLYTAVGGGAYLSRRLPVHRNADTQRQITKETHT